MIYLILLLLAFPANAKMHYAKVFNVKLSRNEDKLQTIKVLVEYSDDCGWNTYPQGKYPGIAQEELDMAEEKAREEAKKIYFKNDVPAKAKVDSVEETNEAGSK